MITGFHYIIKKRLTGRTASESLAFLLQVDVTGERFRNDLKYSWKELFSHEAVATCRRRFPASSRSACVEETVMKAAVKRSVYNDNRDQAATNQVRI